ncbi:hypothetical protein GCM10009534_15870 [Kribbella sandramycini]
MAGHVATVTLDHVAKRNALTMAMWVSLNDVLRGLGDDPQVRVVVLRGAGAHFSAGDLVDATWAERTGLITELTTEDVDKRAQQLAHLLTTRSQTTIRAAKQLTAGHPADLAWPDSDYREGVRAYRERRPPSFPG